MTTRLYFVHVFTECDDTFTHDLHLVVGESSADAEQTLRNEGFQIHDGQRAFITTDECAKLKPTQSLMFVTRFDHSDSIHPTEMKRWIKQSTMGITDSSDWDSIATVREI